MLGDRDRLTATQKGFLPHEGCLEHSFMLHRALESARARKNEVVVVWLDLADAFGSDPHEVIRRTLVDASVPARVVDTVVSLYQDSTVHLRAREGYRSHSYAVGSTAGLPLEPYSLRSGDRPLGV